MFSTAIFPQKYTETYHHHKTAYRIHKIQLVCFENFELKTEMDKN